MDNTKATSSKFLGPGGLKCPCCGPKPGVERDRLRRRTRRVEKQQIIKEVKSMTPTKIEVFCGVCGAGMCNRSRVNAKGSMTQIAVDPCQNCLDQEREQGRQQGIEEMKERIEELESYTQELCSHLRVKP